MPENTVLPVAKVRLITAIIIKGRGLVLASDRLEGNFESGDNVSFVVQNTIYRFTVSSFEMLNIKRSDTKDLISFLVRANKQEKKDLHLNPQIDGVIADIYSATRE